jgi:transposase
VVRARVVLMSAGGCGTREIAQALSIGERTVRKWKARFEEMPCLAGLNDAARSGRPSTIPLEVRCQLVQLACERPDGKESPAPFRDVWSYKALAEAIETSSGHRMSVSEVGRIQVLRTTPPSSKAMAQVV